MMRLFILLCVFCCASFAAQAQLITPRPQCAIVKNDTGGRLYGSIRTAYATDSSGKPQRHEGSFRLEKDQDTEICSTGPFYPGYQVELVVKAMIPLFSCKTRLSGTITIKSERDKDGVNHYSANCVPASTR